MTEKKKNLYYLHELSNYKVAEEYPDVRDWNVIDADKRTIGKVEGLLVNKDAERVVYLDVEVDESLIEAGHQTYAIPANKGIHGFLNEDNENHLIIPIGMVTLDEENSIVNCNTIDYTTFTKTKRFKKGIDIEKSYEQIILPHYFPDNDFDKTIGLNDQFYNRKEFDPPSSSNSL
jgi:hypothetical protein